MTAEIKKQFDFKPKITQRLAAFLIFACILFGSLPAFGARRFTKSSDLVFCPIQKSWVQKYVQPIKAKEPLDEICASEQSKNKFFFEMSKKTPLLRFVRESAQIEKLFFNYLEKGNNVFAQIVPSAPQNFPETQIGRLANVEKSGGDFKIHFLKNETENFAPAQFARPPTARKSVSFETKIPRKLSQISRRIQPRAPPVSLLNNRPTI